MYDRINELKEREKNIVDKIIILLGLMLIIAVFGLPLYMKIIGSYLVELFNLELWLSCLLGILFWGLTETILYNLLKKSFVELESNCKECKKNECMVEYNKTIENIKNRFDGLSKDRQKELLNFIKNDNEIRKIFLDINDLDLDDREKIYEYFFNSYEMNKSEIDDSYRIVSQRPSDVENESNISYARKRCLRTERKYMNKVNYGEDGQF